MKRKTPEVVDEGCSAAPADAVASSPTKEKKAKATKKTKQEEVCTTAVENFPDESGKMVHDLIQPRPVPEGATSCKIISWNVAGLRAVVKKAPMVIDELIQKYDPDVICLQETKLQTDHVAEFQELLARSPTTGQVYTSFWSCSTVKLGYSGTMVLVKGTGGGAKGATAAKPVPKQATLAGMWGKKQESPANTTPTNVASAAQMEVVSVAYDCQLPVALVGAGAKAAKLCPGEGRTVTVEFPGFYLINCYVPNSGQDLVRLDYRTKTWDPALRVYLETLQQHKPVIFAGDLNCGHLDLDIWNCHAKHIPKQSGLTPEEREGFSTMLSSGRQPCPPAPATGTSSGFIDALRYCYPFARGQFSYWSQRSFARPVNKGIRLDYFVCSRSFVAPYEEAAAGGDNAGGMEAIVSEQEAQALAEITAAPTAPRTLTSCLDLALQRSKGGAAATATATAASAAAPRVPVLLDSYTLPHDTVGISDHAPVMLVLQV